VEYSRRTARDVADVLGGALNRNLKIQAGETLLIRGGTTSVGLAAAAIAKSQGLTVLAIMRRADREARAL
jgi:NADPH:quinone reductase-like Zn-dependent oxidoreductase